MTTYEYNFLNTKANVRKYLEAHGCEMLDYWSHDRKRGPSVSYNGKIIQVPLRCGGVFRNDRTNATFEWSCYIDGTNQPFLTVMEIVRYYNHPESDVEFEKAIGNRE